MDNMLFFITGMLVSYYAITTSTSINNVRFGLLCILILYLLGNNKIENFKNHNEKKIVKKDKKNKGKHILYFMFAPWCGYSKGALPMWDKLVKEKKYEIDYIKINSEDSSSKKIIQKYKVKGFPTFIFQPFGKNDHKVYEGDRTIKSMNKFIAENM